jgi:hypothetical protein
MSFVDDDVWDPLMEDEEEDIRYRESSLEEEW